MIDHFITRFNSLKSCEIEKIENDALEKLCKYEWPGNIRELENIIERMVVLKFEGKLEIEDIPQKIINRIELASENYKENLLKGLNLPEEAFDLESLLTDIRKKLESLALDKFENDSEKVLSFLKTKKISK